MLQEGFRKKNQDPLPCDVLTEVVILNVDVLFSALNMCPLKISRHTVPYAKICFEPRKFLSKKL